MKKWMTFFLAAGLVLGVMGCGETKTTVNTSEGELTVKFPSEVKVKQDSKETLEFEVDRKKFTEDVEVSFKDLPKGVSAKDSTIKIAKGSDKGTATIEAKGDADPVTNHKAKVVIKGGKSSTEKDLSVTVLKK